jgi:hypothetical protein
MTIATRNAFFYGASESIAQTAIAYSLTAARYTVLAYDFLTSDNAKATYRWIGGMTVALGQLAFWSAIWAYAKVSEWAEAEVQSSLAQPTPDHIADARKKVSMPPQAPLPSNHPSPSNGLPLAKRRWPLVTLIGKSMAITIGFRLGWAEACQRTICGRLQTNWIR